MALHSPDLPPAADFNCIELCAGAGGIGLGLAIAVPLAFGGFRARGVCHVEREAFAAATLVGHMEAGVLDPAPVWADLGTFDGRPWRGRIHCVASGDPCQPNSVAGRGLGAADERFLADQVVRVVAEARPLCLVRENVPGNADGQLAVLVPALEGLGYRIECGLFSSGETGNSHGRKRLIMVAWDTERDGWLGHAIGGADQWDQIDARWRAEFGIVADRASVGGSGSLDHAQDDQWRRELEAEGTRRGRPRPARAGAGMVHSARIGQRERRPEPTGIEGRSAVAEHGGELADSDSAHVSRRRSSPDPAGRQEPDGHAGLGGRELPAADGGQSGDGQLQRGGKLGFQPEGDGAGRGLAGPLLIPGPSDPRWPELAPAIDEAEAERLLRGGLDALADRVDRLRLLGNGVDPVALAYAFLCLLARHREAAERAARNACDARKHPPLTEALFNADALLKGIPDEG